MKWGKSLTIGAVLFIIGPQNGFGGRLRASDGEVNGILTISPTNC